MVALRPAEGMRRAERAVQPIRLVSPPCGAHWALRGTPGCHWRVRTITEATARLLAREREE